MIIEGKRFRLLHNFTRDFDPGFEYIKMVRCGVQWYMMESKDCFLDISFRYKDEQGTLISFKGQSIIFGLSIKEI